MGKNYHDDQYEAGVKRQRTSLPEGESLAAYEREIVNTQVEEWINKGIIRPSTSEYASPGRIGCASTIASSTRSFETDTSYC